MTGQAGGSPDDPDAAAFGTEPGVPGDELTEGCQDILPVADVYQVANAGEVEVRHGDDDVELVAVRPAEGWSHEVESRSGERIAVALTGPERTLAFEVTYVDEQAQGRVCVEEPAAR